MSMKILFLSLMLISTVSLSFPQNNDDGLQDELSLSDTEFEEKYIQKMNSLVDLRQGYLKTKDPRFKILYLKRMSQFLPDDLAYDTLFQVLSEEISSPKQKESFWKIRGSIIFFFGENGNNLPEEKKIRVVEEIIKHFREETEPYIISICAYSLVKLTTNESSYKSSHRLTKKRTITYLFSERLLELKSYENFLCSHLVEASVQLNDPELHTVLQEIRKRHFHPKVLEQIDKALKVLTPKN